ncbi:MAG: type VI secretion system protein ImpF [Halocynthiibacter sp.]|jgi:type VI secretion system protein ImpF
MSPGNSKNQESKGHRQVSIMHVFRSAAESGDARDGKTNYQGGDRELTARSKERREGTDEGTLKSHLSADLGNLMNTIRLDAAVSLSDAPFVERSIVNFGFRDMSSVSASAMTNQNIIQSIRESLINYEPRLIAETIEITINKSDAINTQRLTFDISAEMVASPVDVPLDFVAEVDLGAGKIQMTRLKVQT